MSIFDNKKISSFITYLTLSFILISCSGNKKNENKDSLLISDTAAVVPVGPLPGDSAYHFQSSKDILTFLDTSSNASKYKGGIFYTIAREVPDYADKLIPQMKKYDYFIVVDKASMQVILFDNFGQVKKAYGMACAKNYGTKHKKADSRTPEGFFSVEGIYNSTDWLYTDDWGNTSPARGQFGPRFIRLKIPTTTQIGIHGTASPHSIGRRVSHGCIRLTNDNILDLVNYASVGMPVIVLPGKRDRAVNRSEGYNIAYFPIGEEYAMTEQEKNEPIRKEPVIFKDERPIKDKNDSQENNMSETSDDPDQSNQLTPAESKSENNKVEVPDSIR